MRLQNYERESCHGEASFDPTEGWIALEQEGGGEHGQSEDKRPENGFFVAGSHMTSVRASSCGV